MHTAVAALTCCLAASVRCAEAPLTLVRASFFGTAENDDIQGACAGPDGTIYIAGTVGAPRADVPGGAASKRLGADAAQLKCGHGFVARLDADGGKVLACAEFGKGILSLTSVRTNKDGVYVAGYATEGLEALLKTVPGLMREYPLRKEVKLLEEGKWLEAVGENAEHEVGLAAVARHVEAVPGDHLAVPAAPRGAGVPPASRQDACSTGSLAFEGALDDDAGGVEVVGVAGRPPGGDGQEEVPAVVAAVRPVVVVQIGAIVVVGDERGVLGGRGVAAQGEPVVEALGPRVADGEAAAGDAIAFVL
jgi:hypothetical protein